MSIRTIRILIEGETVKTVECPNCFNEILLNKEKIKTHYAWCPHCDQLLSTPESRIMSLQKQRKFMDRATPNLITVGGWSEEPYEEPQERVFDAEQFKKLSHPTLALMGFKEYALLRKFQREELLFVCVPEDETK